MRPSPIPIQPARWLALPAALLPGGPSLANDQGLLPTELSVAEMTDRPGRPDSARTAAYGLLRRAHATPEQVARAALLLARTWPATARPDSARRYAGRLPPQPAPPGARCGPAAGLEQFPGYCTAWRQTTKVSKTFVVFVDRRKAVPLPVLRLGNRSGSATSSARAALPTTTKCWPSTYADSLTSEATRRRVAALEAQAARSRQQIQISRLRQRARLQAQSLERLQTRQQLLGLAALVVGTLVLAAGLLRHCRRRETRRLVALRPRPGGQGLRNRQMRAAVGGPLRLAAAEPGPDACLLACLLV